MKDTVSHLSKDTLAIFLFHGVIKENNYGIRNYTRKHIEESCFHEMLVNLKSHGHALSMDEVIHYNSEQQAYPDNSYIISFDDGFENNYSVAAPILKELATPAIFYVSTNFIENNLMSWTDRIEFCFEKVEKGTLKLPWNEEAIAFQNKEDKVVLLDQIRMNVKTNSEINIEELISEVYKQLGINEVFETDDPLDLKMKWNQVQELDRDELFRIGGHTHNHKIMSFLSSDELDYEIDTSLNLLASKAEIHTRHYSYPEGLENCFNQNVIDALKLRRIECCPTAIEGINGMETDLFHLNRVMVS